MPLIHSQKNLFYHSTFRLERMINMFRQHALVLNRSQIGKNHLVLIEGYSKRSKKFLQGRNDHNIRVILPADDPVPCRDGFDTKKLQPGDYAAVYVNSANSQTLKGIPLYYTTLEEFYSGSREKHCYVQM